MNNRRTEYITKIEEKLTQWDSYIQIRGKSGLYDIHKHSENNIRDILNILYDYKLENLGVSNPNFPVIDLGDTVNGICFQVTSNRSNESYNTLEFRFLDSKLNLKEKYPKLNVFILTGLFDDREGLLRATKQTGLDADRIFDFKTILDRARDLSNDQNYKLDKVLEILDKNYISYQYFDQAVKSYKSANAQRFQIEPTFIQPHLIEEDKNPTNFKREDSKQDQDDELKAYSERELRKVSFDEAINESTQFILTGDPGSGKSEVLKNSFQRIIKGQNHTIPIYIDLSKQIQETDLPSLIKRELKKYIQAPAGISIQILSEELYKLSIAKNSLHLFLDGYDEMDKKAIQNWNDNVKTFLIHNPSVALVIAVRRNRILQDITLPINKTYGILPFDNEQINEYVAAVLSEHGQASDAGRVKFIKNKIETSKLFITAPTMIIKMLVQYAVIQKDLDTNIPNTKSEAYRNYFEYIILKKLKDSGIEEPQQTIPQLYDELVKEVFSVLAVRGYLNFHPDKKTRLVDYSKLNQLLSSIEVKNNNRFLYQKGPLFFINELQIIRTEENESYFNHFTYQEFFFAYWLKGKLNPFSTELRWVKSAYAVAKYNQVFSFLVGLMDRREVDEFFDRLNKWPFRIWMLMLKVLDKFTLTKFFFMAEMAADSKLSAERIKIITDRLVQEIRPENEANMQKAIKVLAKLTPGSEIILNKLLELFIANGTYVRRQSIKDYVLQDIERIPAFKEKFVEILNSKERFNRDIAIEVFTAGRIFDDSIREKIIELQFLPKDQANENDGFRYMTEYAKIHPEQCVGYASKYLERLKRENKKRATPIDLFLRYYFAHAMRIPGYDEITIENEVIKYLENDRVIDENKDTLIQALYKTGIRNERFTLVLIQMLRAQSIHSARIFMYFRDLHIVRPEVIELACSFLYSENLYGRERALNYLSQIRYDGYFERAGAKIRIAERVVEILSEESLEEDLNRGGKHYAVEYLGKIKYIENDTTNLIIKKLNDPKEAAIHSYAIRYLMNTKYYSPNFFSMMFNSQTIGTGSYNFSWESNEYFENIEKYVPENKVNDAKQNMSFFFLKNSLALRKELLKQEDSDGWSSHNFENYLRTALALQKIVLYEDEVSRLRKL